MRRLRSFTLRGSGGCRPGARVHSWIPQEAGREGRTPNRDGRDPSKSASPRHEPADRTGVAYGLVGTDDLHGMPAIPRGGRVSDVPPTDTSLGDLRLLDVFFYYDGPKLFTCVDNSGQQYIAVFVDEKESAELYLYVPISNGRLQAVRTGDVSLRTVFQNPEGNTAYVVRRDLSGPQAQATRIAASDISTEWLPTDRAVLPLPSNPASRSPSALGGPSGELSTLIVTRRVRNAGVPSQVLDVLSRAFGARPEPLVGAITRIFGWSLTDLIDSAELKRPDTSAVAGRFKSQVNQNPALETYTMWAHWLALLVDQAVVRPRPEIPESPHAIREDILAHHEHVRFEGLLDWCWEQGIAVLPLGDPGVFHGAVWNIDGRVVVVLKQRTLWESRWTFDLAHELGHVARHLETSGSVVELGETNPLARNDDEDEVEANEFAADLLLGKPDALARELVERTGRDLRRLKSQTQRVATEHGVESDALANYMAWRLELEGENWWATAATLQDNSGHAPAIARDIVLQRIDWTRLTDDDAALLRAALDWHPEQ